MNYHIAFSPGARIDIRLVVGWYERTDPNLALRFLLDMAATVNRMRRYPYTFPLIKGVVRRAVLRRFPYYIYYFLDANEVFVITIVHQRQADPAWMDRDCHKEAQRR